MLIYAAVAFDYVIRKVGKCVENHKMFTFWKFKVIQQSSFCVYGGWDVGKSPSEQKTHSTVEQMVC